MVLFSFALTGAISAAAGVMITPISFMSYSLRLAPGAEGLRGRDLGGLGNPVGAVVGGFVLGIVEALGVGVVSAGYKDAIAFVILLAGALPPARRAAGGEGGEPAVTALTPLAAYLRRHAGYLVFAVVVMTIPAYLSDTYYLSVLAFMATRFMMALGLSLLLGQAGQISLGQAAFVGIGAYGAAILTTRLGLNPWLAMLIAAVLSATIAGLVGIPTLRLKGYYLAMATLGVNEIIYILLVQLKGLTNGTDGITGIPSLAIGGLDLGGPQGLPPGGVGGGSADVPLRPQPVAARGWAARCGPCTGRSRRRSRWAWTPRTARCRCSCWPRCSPASPGSFDAYYVHYISPESYTITFSIILITGVIIGGLRHASGELCGGRWSS